MRGLPGSGKSTIASVLATRHEAVIVCRDELRQMMYNTYTPDADAEDVISGVEVAMVENLLKQDKDIVIDSVNARTSYLKAWAKLAHKYDADFQVIDVKTSLEESLNRNQKRAIKGGRYVPPEVIESFAKQFQWKVVEALDPIVVAPVSEKDLSQFHRDAIIVDIDGTLAHRVPGGRSPYDYSRVSEDTVDESIRDVVNKLAKKYDILIVSGRKHICKDETASWLTHNGIVWDRLYMRDGDHRDRHGNQSPDWIIKYEIFNEHIRSRYRVVCVLDDRDQVVRMWRKLGLKCLQVQPGDF